MYFMPYEKPLVFMNRTHLWCELEDGTIGCEPTSRCEVHADVFGAYAWDTSSRGYVFENESVVTCHGNMSPNLERKLAKKLEHIVYKSDSGNTTFNYE